jgi:predicted outer membrane repeat protein
MKITNSFFFIFLPFLLLSQNNLTFSGTISKNTTWNFDTVFLSGDILIKDSFKLIVVGGTKVIPLGFFKIQVKGSIQAKGTPNSLIKFTVLDTLGFLDSSSYKGGWNGIEFDNITSNNDSSIIEYCLLEFGKAVKENSNGGCFYIDNSSKIRIDKSVFLNNYSKFSGGAIYFTNNSSPIIQNCNFKQNYSNWSGGALSLQNKSTPLIRNNNFLENFAFYVGNFSVTGVGGAIEISNNSDDEVKIVNNLFANNISIGGTIYESNINTKVIGNIIVNNYGGGIVCGSQISNSKYINNTIINNEEGAGVTLYIEQMGNVILYNNIIQHSVDFFTDSSNVSCWRCSLPTSYNNNIGLIPNELKNRNNFDKPTLFVRPTTVIGLGENGWEADWRLQKGSPEIDAGTLNYGVAAIIDTIDIYGAKRVIGSTIDIGAAEYNPITVIPEPYTSDKIKVYPNPFADHFWLQSEDITLDADYAIYTIEGQLISTFPIKGNDTKLIELDTYSSGTYLLRIVEKSGNVLYASKVIKQ